MKTHRRDAGFSLSALIFFATAASVFIAAVVPAYQMQAKRELEEELLFRGQEYTRAIQKYQRKFGVYPSSLDQLVSTNNLRFVRRAYKDPITGKDFRLILVNPDGSVTGSKLFQQNINNQSLFGNTQQFGQGQNNPQQQQRGQQPQPFQQSQQLQQGLQQQSQPQQPGGLGAGGGITNPQQQFQPQRGTQGQPTNNPFVPLRNVTGGGATPGAVGGIIGVASESSKESIKVYNNRQKYDEWEFIAILGQQGQQPNLQQQQNPQNPQLNQAPGQRQNNPFQTPGSPGSSPFGPAPGGSPFGPPAGQRQNPPGKFP